MAGAHPEIVVISSSPPEDVGSAPRPLSPLSPSDRRVPMGAISPLSLSPGVSPRREALGTSKAAPGAAAVPADIARGFATARSVLQLDEDFKTIQEALSRQTLAEGYEGEDESAKKPKRRVTKATANGDIAESKPKLRERKPVKPRIHRTTTDSGSELPPKLNNIRASKPKGPTRSAARSHRTDTGVLSEHFRKGKDAGSAADAETEESEPLPGARMHKPRENEDSIWDVPLSPSNQNFAPVKKRPSGTINQPLELDEAVHRRRDWTPPADTVDTGAHDMLADLPGKENKPSAAQMETGEFTNMLSGYTYTHLDLTSDTITSKSTRFEVAGSTKRRKVELVEVRGNQAAPRPPSPEKGRASKRKARTITDLVTRQYIPKDPNAEATSVTSDFFAPRTTTTKVPLNDSTEHDATNPTKPTRKRSSSKTASGKGEMTTKLKKASAKAGAEPKMVATKLLSPSSAVMKLNRQDVLFGTSSQLALDESPTTVRGIQQAIRASEDDAQMQEGAASDASSRRAMWPRLDQAASNRSLWDAGSRDEYGQLLEKQNDVYMPDPDRTQDFPLFIDGACDERDSSFVHIDDFRPPTSNGTSTNFPTAPAMNAADPIDSPSRVEENATSFVDIEDFPQEPPPSNQHVDSSFADIDDFPPSAQPFPRPTSAPAAAWGTPKKRRGGPPKAKAKPKPDSAPPTPPRTKGRFANVEEILDSEDDEALSPTPPRVGRLVDSPPPPLSPSLPDEPDDLVPIFRIEALLLEWVNLKPIVSSEISKEIGNLAPSDDPFVMNWREKMFSFYPFILEDFTNWLNKTTFIRTYKRATQKQYKTWLRYARVHEEKPRVAAGQVLAVRKDLETWMVRRWCEEMGICVITRANKAGGARHPLRKGLF